MNGSESNTQVRRRRQSEGTEQVLFDEAWKSERVVNVFRSILWIGAGTLSLAMHLQRFREMRGAPIFSLAWGTLTLLLSVFWLRRRFHPLLPTVLTTVDLTLLGAIMSTVYGGLAAVNPEGARYQLTGMVSGFFVIFSAKALHFSWKGAAWCVLYGTAVYSAVVLSHVGFDGRVPLNIFFLLAVGALMVLTSRRLRLLIHRVKERDAFARFLPGPVVERIARDPLALKLGGEEQEATVLFADVRDFTALSATLPPEQVVRLLNEYFTEMVDEIFAWEGILDKFIGDGICAVFGSSIAGGDQARRAVSCALGMIRRLEKINQRRAARGEPALRVGIGIHTGKLVAGAIGSPLRMEYTHIGDTVNTASRIEGLCKEMAETVLVSDIAYERAGGASAFPARPMAPAKVKGKDQPLLVFALNPS